MIPTWTTDLRSNLIQFSVGQCRAFVQLMKDLGLKHCVIRHSTGFDSPPPSLSFCNMVMSLNHYVTSVIMSLYPGSHNPRFSHEGQKEG